LQEARKQRKIAYAKRRLTFPEKEVCIWAQNVSINKLFGLEK